MRYRVELYPSEEGFAVSCPRLPGCWSQGATEEEALENIRVAIQEYLAAQLPSLSAERLGHLYVEVFVEAPPPVRGEALARVRRVLASLPARDAEVLRVMFLEDVGKDEIAERFGIDRDYLRILLQRARDRFHRLYVDAEPDAVSQSAKEQRDPDSSRSREVEVAV